MGGTEDSVYLLGKIALLSREIYVTGNFTILPFACLKWTFVVYWVSEIHEPMPVNTWYYNFRKTQQKLSSLILKIALFAKTEFFPDINDLSLMAIATFFFCSWVVKSLCSNLTVVSLPYCVFTFISIKLHTEHILLFCWICVKWKKYLFLETWSHDSS